MRQKFSIRARIRSFRYAFNGLRLLFVDEHNARIHAVATILVVAGAWWFDFSTAEWTAVLLAIGMVISAEAVNSAIERLCDRVSAERDPMIGQAKDLAAGAVLILAIAAAVVGLVIFTPHIVALF